MASLRVLIVSENVSMQMGGESSLPFYYAALLGERGVEVWLACHERVRDEVQARFPELRDRVRFAHDSWLQKTLHNHTGWLPYRIRDLFIGQFIHYSTQWRLRRVAKELAARNLIDVVLEPSPITPKGLSFMYDVGVPVVIGPMCGGMEFPPAFRKMDSWVTRGLVKVGRVLSQVANRLVPGKIDAMTLLVANELTEKALPHGVKGQVIRLFESGVDLKLWRPSSSARPADGEVRFVFSGRFVDWKGIQFLIPAFEKAAARNSACILDLIGGGGEFDAEIKRLAENPVIRDRIRFHGWVPRERAAEILREADVFVMPSLRECGGTAILEAMALGKPVITTNWGGPADYVDSTCGILVAPNSAAAFVDGLADAIVELAQSPERREALGCGGLARIRRDYLAWDDKAERVHAILEDVVRRSISRE